MKWKKYNYLIHRDLGYFCIGLTLIYAISGIVLNHISHSWNPSYSIVKSTRQVSPLAEGTKPDMDYVDAVLGNLGETGKFKNVAMLSPSNLRIFVEGSTLDVNLQSGLVNIERVSKRPILYELNHLHLNKPKGSWTWIADVYGASLGLLAITGLLMLKPRRQPRAVFLLLAGAIMPILYIFFTV